MKKCPFCAEEIQDAAIKCRYCGSMVGPLPAGVPPEAAAAPPPATVTEPPSPVLPDDDLDERAAPQRAGGVPLLAWLVIGLGLLTIGVLLALRSGGDDAPGTVTGGPVVTEAASVAPAEPTAGDYEFLDIPWGMDRAAVRTRLEARGFRYLETDEEGDDQFEGRVDGRDAGVAAMYSDDRLTKFLVVMLAADPEGGLLTHMSQELAKAYGTPAEQRGAAMIWPERTGTLVWITSSETRNVAVHYEAAGWPEESRRRKEGRTTGD